MILTNSHISDDCTRKAMVSVDKNGHYNLTRLVMVEGVGWAVYIEGRMHFKHIESCNRAVAKWIGRV